MKKTKNFIADDFLKTVDKTKGYNHYRHTDTCGRNCKPNNKPRKIFLAVKCNPF